MSLKDFKKPIDNWFTFNGFLSKTGVLLIVTSLVLTFISYGKGIQVLMFIPSFVLAVFIYSFFNVYFLKKSLKTKFITLNGKKYLQIIWKKSFYDSYFRLAFDNGEKIEFLTPKNNFSFDLKEEIGKYLLVVQGRFDVFRHVIKFENIQLTEDNDFNSRGIEDMYLFSRPIEDGEGAYRLDYIRSAKTNEVFIKEVILEKLDDNSDAKSDGNSGIRILSQYNTTLIKKVKNGEFIEWMMILLGIIVIFLEWGNISFLLFSSFFALFTFFKSSFFKRSIDSQILMKIGFIILFIGFFVDGLIYQDWIAAGAHFLLLSAILKHLFKREFRDSFTYIFLILFIFVTLSLLTLKSWFIIFFAIFIFLTINIFMAYSGGDLKSEFKNYFVLKKKGFLGFFIIYFSIFLLTIFLFFILPHGDKEKKDMSMFRAQESEGVKTGFDDEVSLDNIQELKNDYSKVFVLENAKKEDVNKYKKMHWRGMRFLNFDDNSWNKIPGNNKRFKSSDLKIGEYEEWIVKYYLDSSKNIFVPKIPLQISDRNIYQHGDDNTVFYYREPQFVSKKVTFKFKINNGNIVEKKSSLKKINFSIKPEIEKLFEKYWSKIPEKYTKNPKLLTEYVRDYSGFSYSMETPAKNLKSFLYDEKKGHCEYYATVLTLTLQKFGYQATFVNGFYGGEWNDLASAWLVRGADAHSWTEVLNNDGTWSIYDATPVFRYQGFWFNDLKAVDTIIEYYDVIDLKWYNYIVGFTGKKQEKIWNSVISNYEIILYLLFLILFFSLSKNIFYPYILNHLKRTRKERFMWWLKNKLKGDSFILKEFEEKYPDLVNETREIIFSKKEGNFKKLKEKWRKISQD